MVLLKDPEWGRRQDVRTADQIAAALALIRQSDERWHGLTVWLSHGGMDRDAELLDRFGGAGQPAAGIVTLVPERVDLLGRFLACESWAAEQQPHDQLLATCSHVLTGRWIWR